MLLESLQQGIIHYCLLLLSLHSDILFNLVTKVLEKVMFCFEERCAVFLMFLFKIYVYGLILTK